MSTEASHASHSAASGARDPRESAAHVARIVRVKRWFEDRLAWPREWSHPAVYAEGVRLWRDLYRQEYTMVSCRRGRALHRLAADVERHGVPGDLVDCGVWNGGS